jgi:hypothetical protein
MKIRLCRKPTDEGVVHLWYPEPVKSLAGYVFSFIYRCHRCRAIGYGVR